MAEVEQTEMVQIDPEAWAEAIDLLSRLEYRIVARIMLRLSTAKTVSIQKSSESGADGK